MEKIMFFGVALWIGVMMSINPRPVQNTDSPVPKVDVVNFKTESVHNPDAPVNSGGTKPVRIYPKAEVVHRLE
jgi:hypothetical protein